PNVSRITDHTFKQQPCLIQLVVIRLTGARQHFNKPKGAHVESTFFTRESINTGMWRIAMHEAVADKPPLTGIFKDSVQRLEHPRVGWGHEKEKRNNKERRMQVLTAVKLCKCFALFVTDLDQYFFEDVLHLY